MWSRLALLSEKQCPSASSQGRVPVCQFQYQDLLGVRTLEVVGCAEVAVQDRPSPYGEKCTRERFSDYGMT